MFLPAHLDEVSLVEVALIYWFCSDCATVEIDDDVSRVAGYASFDAEEMPP